jgi:hypothetical protein
MCAGSITPCKWAISSCHVSLSTGSDARPASDLIRMMELRIERQQASVKRLKQAGEETSPAMQKLTLLLRALDEMRFQLNQRAATSTDET